MPTSLAGEDAAKVSSLKTTTLSTPGKTCGHIGTEKCCNLTVLSVGTFNADDIAAMLMHRDSYKGINSILVRILSASQSLYWEFTSR